MSLVSSLTSIGPYRPIRALGAGIHGEVWHAYDEQRSRPVALKVSTNLSVRDEGRLMARLHHPALPRPYATGRQGSLFYVAMELRAGRTLLQCLHDGPRRRMALAYGLARQLGEALTYMHQQDIVHGDLQPCNVLVSKQQHMTLLDFGLARKVGSRGGGGTRGFIAPEVIQGGAVTCQSDAFSLGALLHLIVTSMFVPAWILHAPTLPRRCRLVAHDGWNRLLLHLLHPDPARRISLADLPEALLYVLQEGVER